jgi:hypothetical protein
MAPKSDCLSILYSYYIIDWLGKGNRICDWAIKILGFRAKWFIGFKAFKGHI